MRRDKIRKREIVILYKWERVIKCWATQTGIKAAADVNYIYTDGPLNIQIFMWPAKRRKQLFIPPSLSLSYISISKIYSPKNMSQNLGRLYAKKKREKD